MGNIFVFNFHIDFPFGYVYKVIFWLIAPALEVTSLTDKEEKKL